MTRGRRVPPKPRARRPVRRPGLYALASVQKWDEVYTMIDDGKACVDDFNDVSHRCPPRPIAHRNECHHLLRRATQFGNSAIFAAAVSPMDLSCCVAAIDELVKRGATINMKDCYVLPNSVLHYVARYGSVKALKRLVFHGGDLTALNQVRPRSSPRVCVVWRSVVSFG